MLCVRTEQVFQTMLPVVAHTIYFQLIQYFQYSLRLEFINQQAFFELVEKMPKQAP